MSVEAGETTDIACTPQIEIVLRYVKDTKAVEDKLWKWLMSQRQAMDERQFWERSWTM